MRLDVALVHRLGGVAALDDHVGLLEAGLDVALVELRRAWRCSTAWSASARRPPVNRSSCSTGASGCIASSTSITCGSTSYFTSISSSASSAIACDGRGHRGDGVALVQRLLARHARCATGRGSSSASRRRDASSDGMSGKSSRGDDRLHARQLQRLRRCRSTRCARARAACASPCPTACRASPCRRRTARGR